jgi:hypothetical protein
MASTGKEKQEILEDEEFRSSFKMLETVKEKAK